MIPFFRKIRRHLLKNNKVSRYLLYALGEILLVVIGILIALQVDNWNEEHKDRRREAALLAEINRDFRVNLDLLKQSQAVNQRSLSACDAILRSLATLEQSGTQDSVGASINNVLVFSSYDPSSGMVNSLISSGAIELIRNDSLRNLLIGWPDTLRDFKEEEENANRFFISYIWPWMMDNFDIANPENPMNERAFRDYRFRNILLVRREMMQSLISGEDQRALEKALKGIIRMSQ